MKKIKLKLLPLLAVLAAFVITSCGKDDAISAVLPSVTVTATVDGEALASGDDVSVGSAVVLNISVSAPGGVNGLDVNGTSYSRTDLGADAGDTSGSLILNITAPTVDQIGNTATFEMEAVDDLGQTSATVTFTYNIIAAPSPDVNSWSAVLLGAQGNAEEGFYDAMTDTEYSYAQARDASGVDGSPIDLAYYYGNTNKNTIAAIDDAGLNNVYTAVSLPIEGIFGTRNATRFLSSTLSATEFEAISTNAELETAASFEVAGSSSSTELVLDQVIAFKLDEARGGDYGLIRISSIDDTNGNGTITIEVKVPGEEAPATN